MRLSPFGWVLVALALVAVAVTPPRGAPGPTLGERGLAAGGCG